MSKESMAGYIVLISTRTAARRPPGIVEIMCKESLSVKDFSWKQHLADHQANWRNYEQGVPFSKRF